jgi:hypothetical protein
MRSVLVGVIAMFVGTSVARSQPTKTATTQTWVYRYYMHSLEASGPEPYEAVTYTLVVGDDVAPTLTIDTQRGGDTNGAASTIKWRTESTLEYSGSLQRGKGGTAIALRSTDPHDQTSIALACRSGKASIAKPSAVRVHDHGEADSGHWSPSALHSVMTLDCTAATPNGELTFGDAPGIEKLCVSWSGCGLRAIVGDRPRSSVEWSPPN